MLELPYNLWFQGPIGDQGGPPGCYRVFSTFKALKQAFWQNFKADSKAIFCNKQIVFEKFYVGNFLKLCMAK